MTPIALSPAQVAANIAGQHINQLNNGFASIAGGISTGIPAQSRQTGRNPDGTPITLVATPAITAAEYSAALGLTAAQISYALDVLKGAQPVPAGYVPSA